MVSSKNNPNYPDDFSADEKHTDMPAIETDMETMAFDALGETTCACEEEATMAADMATRSNATYGNVTAGHVKTSFGIATGQLVDGKYRIVQQVGLYSSGGIMYHVLQETIGRFYDMVVIMHKSFWATLRNELAAYYRQAATLGSLMRCGQLIEIYDMGEDEAGHFDFVIQEHVDGIDLESILESVDHLEVHEAMVLLRELTDVLAAAEANGIVFGDIRPRNIFLSRNGELKVIGPGYGHMIGEPGPSEALLASDGGPYQAPEVAACPERTDVRTDIYALGMTLFHLLTGQAPETRWSQGNQNALGDKSLNLRKALTGVSSPIVRLVQRMIAHDAHARFATTSALKKEMGQSGIVPPTEDWLPIKLNLLNRAVTHDSITYGTGSGKEKHFWQGIFTWFAAALITLLAIIGIWLSHNHFSRSSTGFLTKLNDTAAILEEKLENGTDWPSLPNSIMEATDSFRREYDNFLYLFGESTDSEEILRQQEWKQVAERYDNLLLMLQDHICTDCDTLLTLQKDFISKNDFSGMASFAKDFARLEENFTAVGQRIYNQENETIASRMKELSDVWTKKVSQRDGLVSSWNEFQKSEETYMADNPQMVELSAQIDPLCKTFERLAKVCQNAEGFLQAKNLNASGLKIKLDEARELHENIEELRHVLREKLEECAKRFAVCTQINPKYHELQRQCQAARASLEEMSRQVDMKKPWDTLLEKIQSAANQQLLAAMDAEHRLQAHIKAIPTQDQPKEWAARFNIIQQDGETITKALSTYKTFRELLQAVEIQENSDQATLVTKLNCDADALKTELPLARELLNSVTRIVNTAEEVQSALAGKEYAKAASMRHRLNDEQEAFRKFLADARFNILLTLADKASTLVKEILAETMETYDNHVRHVLDMKGDLQTKATEMGRNCRELESLVLSWMQGEVRYKYDDLLVKAGKISNTFDETRYLVNDILPPKDVNAILAPAAPAAERAQKIAQELPMMRLLREHQIEFEQGLVALREKLEHGALPSHEQLEQMKQVLAEDRQTAEKLTLGQEIATKLLDQVTNQHRLLEVKIESSAKQKIQAICEQANILLKNMQVLQQRLLACKATTELDEIVATLEQLPAANDMEAELAACLPFLSQTTHAQAIQQAREQIHGGDAIQKEMNALIPFMRRLLDCAYRNNAIRAESTWKEANANLGMVEKVCADVNAGISGLEETVFSRPVLKHMQEKCSILSKEALVLAQERLAEAIVVDYQRLRDALEQELAALAKEVEACKIKTDAEKILPNEKLAKTLETCKKASRELGDWLAGDDGYSLGESAGLPLTALAEKLDGKVDVLAMFARHRQIQERMQFLEMLAEEICGNATRRTERHSHLQEYLKAVKEVQMENKEALATAHRQRGETITKLENARKEHWQCIAAWETAKANAEDARRQVEKTCEFLNEIQGEYQSKVKVFFSLVHILRELDQHDNKNVQKRLTELEKAERSLSDQKVKCIKERVNADMAKKQVELANQEISARFLNKCAVESRFALLQKRIDGSEKEIAWRKAALERMKVTISLLEDQLEGKSEAHIHDLEKKEASLRETEDSLHHEWQEKEKEIAAALQMSEQMETMAAVQMDAWQKKDSSFQGEEKRALRAEQAAALEMQKKEQEQIKARFEEFRHKAEQGELVVPDKLEPATDLLDWPRPPQASFCPSLPGNSTVETMRLAHFIMVS